MLRSFILPSCTLAILLGFSVPASAVLIDDFSTAQGPITDVTSDATFVTSTSPGPISGTIIGAGGIREINVSMSGVGGATLNLGAGQIDYFSSASASGQFFVNYVPPAAVDFSPDTGITVIGSLDLNAQAGTTLGLLLQDSDSTAIDSVVLTDASYTHTFPFSNFSGIDPTDIIGLVLGTFDSTGTYINIPQGGSISIFSPFQSTNTQIPEPGSLAIWSLVGVGLYFVARCRRRK